jgi:phosphatidylglycerol:prolipoprotein diacylglycerol transferase
MQPVLFSIFGFDVQTYGVSKALAAWVAALLLARAFQARGLDREHAYSFVLWSTVWGFAGAKVYFLFEQLPTLTVHDFSGMGFTWYGGLIGGTLAAMVMVRRWQLPLGTVAGAVAVPLSVGYAIGRLGCLLSGDGTYGRPTTLPWGMAFPNGVVATDVPVHPTPLYEAIGALVIAGILWWLGRRASGPAVFAGYLILSGLARFLVEFLRTSSTVFLGMTQPQLWALVGIAAGVLLAGMARRGGRNEHVPIHGTIPAASAGTADREEAGLAR